MSRNMTRKHHPHRSKSTVRKLTPDVNFAGVCAKLRCGLRGLRFVGICPPIPIPERLLHHSSMSRALSFFNARFSDLCLRNHDCRIAVGAANGQLCRCGHRVPYLALDIVHAQRTEHRQWNDAFKTCRTGRGTDCSSVLANAKDAKRSSSSSGYVSVGTGRIVWIHSPRAVRMSW